MEALVGTWSSFSGILIHHLWNDRNQIVFQGISSLDFGSMHQVLSQAQFIHKEYSKGTSSNYNDGYHHVVVSWKLPKFSAYKINVDGSYKATSGIAACSGFIRDDNGDVTTWFHKKLLPCNAPLVELRGLKFGIHLAKDMNLHSVCVESDSLVVVNLVKGDLVSPPYLKSIIQSIKFDLRKMGQSSNVHHVLCEVNKSVDMEANLGHQGRYSLVVFNFLPPVLAIVVVALVSYSFYFVFPGQLKKKARAKPWKVYIG